MIASQKRGEETQKIRRLTRKNNVGTVQMRRAPDREDQLTLINEKTWPQQTRHNSFTAVIQIL